MANFNLNKVVLGGRLTSNPELKTTPSGVMVLSFSIAVARRTAPKKEDGTRGEAVSDFINCIAWRERAEFISKYFHKGSSICVTGAIQTRTYQDKDGNKRNATEVVVDETYFVDAKGDAGHTPPPSDADAPAVYTPATVTGTAAASTGSAVAPQFELIDSEEELPF